MRVYDTDKQSDFEALLKKVNPGQQYSVYPRRHAYGTPMALDAGLMPLDAVPNVLIPPDEYRERIEEAHQLQTMPLYFMYKWRPKGTRYNQNGIGYCWTWSGTGCCMTTRAAEDKDKVILSPVSMGYLVNWQDRGNYLESFIRGAREDGICPDPNGNLNSLNRSASFWSQYSDKRKLYRLDKVWDTDSRNMTQHCISILYYGRSCYIAYNWWSHALELTGVRYNGNTLEWIISNSHNEDDVIILTGSRAIPDEAYGFISTVAV